MKLICMKKKYNTYKQTCKMNLKKDKKIYNNSQIK